MHAHEDVLAVADVALDERDVVGVVEHRPVADGAELAVRGRDLRLGDPLDLLLGAAAPGDEVGDGDDGEVVLGGEDLQLVEPGHAVVVLLADDLADDADRPQPGEAAQVDRRLGVAGAAQHAAVERAQRVDVAGPGQVVRRRRRVGEHLHGARPVAGARCRS